MTQRRKTYSHLAGLRRRPTEYDIVTSRLHAYVGRGFAVTVPLSDWYARYQTASPLQCPDWEVFRDPRETTYPKYTALQNQQETFVNGVLESIERTNYDANLPGPWFATLERLLPPLRYPFHGLQMLAAYVGQMAPGGRITIAASFQAADEMRRVQRLAYRMRQLQGRDPTFGADAKLRWQEDAVFQPLREMIERLLVTYDWGEAFVGLNLCLKPRLDNWCFGQLAAHAGRRGDPLLAELLRSLADDGGWHIAWSQALVQAATKAQPENKQIIINWQDRWDPLAERAVQALRAGFGVEESAQNMGSLPHDATVP
jgi:toluene monooxygenase system protein E